MKEALKLPKMNKLIVILLLCVGIFGLCARFYHITDNQFIYYDEGLYLEHGIDFLLFMEKNPAKNASDFLRYLNIATHLALADAKFLWFFLASLRAFFLNVDSWFFTRVLSAIFGALTVLLVYRFSKKFYNSKSIGLLSACMLAVMPSHFYYSRLGMQEGLSTFLFLAGMYFYFFPKRLHFRTFLSGIMFSGVFFTNYRMIILPVILLFVELIVSFPLGKKFNLQQYIWCTLTFLLIVFGVGNIDQGANTNITFTWMFYQSHLAKGRFAIINLFSYPFYLFYLESIFWGVGFFGNIYFLIKRKWREAFSFLLVCLLMIIFSFAQEKGVRYLCVVTPFMAIAVAVFIDALFKWRASIQWQRGVGVVLVMMLGVHVFKIVDIARFKSAYQQSIEDIRRVDQGARFLSTQFLIQKCYVKNRKDVLPVHKDLKVLLAMYMNGYRYLVIDPQAYISMTEDGNRFSFKLKGVYEFISKTIKPIKVYDHFNKHMLQRFVLEHNEHLLRSMTFINSNKDGQLGKLKVYDLRECIAAIQKVKASQ